MRRNRKCRLVKESSQLNELMIKGIDAYSANEYRTSFECFSQAVVLGDPIAAYLIGRSFYFGQGCCQSYRNAAIYYKKAAKRQVKEALYGLAVCCHYGQGLPKNEDRALMYLVKSADQGYADAQDLLARKYLSGDGRIEVNEAKACHYFRLAADQGFLDSQYALYLMFKLGHVPQDMAMKYLRLAAEAGYAKAQRCLGECYHYGEYGLPENKVLALYWCEQAATQNDAEAAFCCGLAYQEGDGVEIDAQKAIDYHRSAARQGYVPAYAQLYRAIIQSQSVELYEEGFNALITGARLGDQDAQCGLSLAYKIGAYGAPLDLEKAEYWDRKSSEHEGG